jgi:hypothetical protein
MTGHEGQSVVKVLHQLGGLDIIAWFAITGTNATIIIQEYRYSLLLEPDGDIW